MYVIHLKSNHLNLNEFEAKLLYLLHVKNFPFKNIVTLERMFCNMKYYHNILICKPAGREKSQCICYAGYLVYFIHITRLSAKDTNAS